MLNRSLRVIIHTLYILLTVNMVLTVLVAADRLPSNFGPIHEWGSFFPARSIFFFISCTILLWLYRNKGWWQHRMLLVAFIFLQIVMVLDAAGNLFGWYAGDTRDFGYTWYDDLVHYLSSVFFTGFWYFLLRWRYRKKSWLWTLGLTIILSWLSGVVFELYELISDSFGRTHMVGGPRDLRLDILYNSLGILTWVLIVIVWKDKTRIGHFDKLSRINSESRISNTKS